MDRQRRETGAVSAMSSHSSQRSFSRLKRCKLPVTATPGWTACYKTARCEQASTRTDPKLSVASGSLGRLDRTERYDFSVILDVPGAAPDRPLVAE
jgi:hypothetical protein